MLNIKHAQALLLVFTRFEVFHGYFLGNETLKNFKIRCFATNTRMCYLKFQYYLPHKQDHYNVNKFFQSY